MALSSTPKRGDVEMKRKTFSLLRTVSAFTEMNEKISVHKHKRRSLFEYMWETVRESETRKKKLNGRLNMSFLRDEKRSHIKQ